MKELYYYVDSTPTHSYMKALYKYPQDEFPYKQLEEANYKRTVYDREYEILDTGKTKIICLHLEDAQFNSHLEIKNFRLLQNVSQM